LTQAVVQAVQGDHAAATASCARVTTLADQLAGFACLAAASVNTARLAASERLLAATLERSAGAPGELRVWALTLLAEMAARRGAAGTAERRFLTALALAPRDSYLLGAYADFLLDAHRPAEVVVLLRDRQRIDALLLRYALALRAAGGNRAALAAAVAELQARFDAAAQRGDNVHQREEARFALHLRGDPAAALALARQNWKTQKELADLRILVEAAQLARDEGTVRAARTWMTRNGTQDVMLAMLAGSRP
jgi:Tfp pilus assembly protein PilF